MIYDSFFTIGSTHHVCQDYAWTWAHMAALSDGCSSSMRSDVGARLLAQLSLKAKDLHPEPTYFVHNMVTLLKDAVATLWLKNDDAFATLLTIWQDEDAFRVVAIGDGAVAARRRNGVIEVWEFGSKQSAPPYLAYRLDNARWQEYEKVYGDSLYMQMYEVGRDDVFPIAETPSPVKEYEDWVFPTAEYDVVAVFSDGVKSFYTTDPNDPSKRSSELDSWKVIGDLMDFKTMGGVFVSRRCSATLKRWEKQGIRHYDDFSMAAAYAND